ncbi:MAG TPA: hypothetical protein VGD00_09335 [Solirubrobacteraceae bacterium]
MSATQGAYSATQMLLDITQGARISSSSYAHSSPPPVGVLTALRPRPGQSPVQMIGWASALRRARAAPQLLTPGLLASSIPGGAAYLASSGDTSIDALAAASRDGTIAAASVGTAASLSARAQSLLRSHRLLVADLPSIEALSALLRTRVPGQLVLVVQRVPPLARAGRLLWAGAAGLSGGGKRELSSPTTRDRGLIAAIDLAPTVLRWLALPVPPEVRGRAIEAGRRLDGGELRALMARLRVVGGRRLRALGLLLACWAALLLAAAPWPRARARVMRAGALGVLLSPLAVMATAALQPAEPAEYALVIVLCLVLGALSDLLADWPRALLVPAVAVPAAIAIDALSGAELLTRSLLGPNPILGARFYGIGNELKSALAVLVLAGLAAALGGRGRGDRAGGGGAGTDVGAASRARPRRELLTFALAGAVLAAIEGAARIGAGVGGVILVCAGFALACVLLLPGRLSRRRGLIVLLAPLAGLLALAAIDLLSAHGSGHFTGSILHARSAGDVRDILVRRYHAAWGELRNQAMPFAAALALAATVAGFRRRERLLAPVAGEQVWPAALAGGVAAGVVGALVEDSGPVLLVVAVFALGCVLSYLWARPPSGTAGMSRAARSRARRQPAAHARSAL